MRILCCAYDVSFIMWSIILITISFSIFIVLGMTSRNLEKKISLLRRTMNLSDEDIRVILGKQPALLHYSADRNLAPTILFLVRALDLSKAELQTMIMECPSIIGYSQKNLRKKFSFFAALYASDDVHGRDRIRKLLVDTPKLLLSSVETGLMPRMKFLHNEIQFTLPELQNLYEKNPRLLLYSLDDNLREKIVFFFILQLQMETKDVRKLLKSYPQVMDYNLDSHIKPIAEYCMTEMGFSSTEFASIILKFPRLFTYSLFRIKHVIGYLRFELNLNPSQVKRVIFQAPQVIGLGEDNVKEKLNILTTRLGLTSEELGHVFSTMPTIICLSANKTLIPKLDYLEQTLHDENYPNNHILKETIIKQPTLIGYSLDGRLRPRMQRLINAGIPSHKITVGISMSEDKFKKWIKSSQSRTMLHSMITRQNSTVSGILYKMFDFKEEELNKVCSEVDGIKSKWTAFTLHSWMAFVKVELGVSDEELKKIILSYPQLLDKSFQRTLKRRLKQLRLANLSILDNLDTTVYYSDDEFADWVSQMTNTNERIERLQLAGVTIDSEQTSALMNMSEDDFLSSITLFELRHKYFNVSECLQSTLQMNVNETDTVLLSFASMEVSIHNINKTIGYLRDLADGDVLQVKHAILQHPELLLSSSLENRLSERISPLLGNSTTNDMLQIVTMSEEDYQSYLSSVTLQTIFTQREIKSILTEVQGVLDASNVTTNLDYLQTQGSTYDVKNALLSRPKILFYSLEKLHDMSNVLATTRKGKKTYQFSNESRAVLRDTLDLTTEEAEYVLSCCKYTSLNDPQVFLVPKLDYLLSKFGESKELALCVLDNPRLLDFSLEDLIVPRMDMLIGEGLDPFQINDIILLTQEEIDKRKDLQMQLNMTGSELNHLLPLTEWHHIKTSSKRNNIQYWASQLDSSPDDNLKKVLLKEPMLLKLSLGNTIMPRMELLVESGCPPSDISEIASLSYSKAQEYCTKMYLCKKLDLSPIKLDKLLADVPKSKYTPDLREKVDILYHVFDQSKVKLNEALFSRPSILKQPLNERIKPRTDVISYLKSIGLVFSPKEIVRLFTLSESKFAKDIAPQLKTWSPILYKKYKEDSTTMKKNDDILSILKDFTPSIQYSYSDETNREVARIVHWR